MPQGHVPEGEPTTPRRTPRPLRGPLDVNTANPMEVCTDGGGTVLAGEDDPFLVEIIDPGRRTGPQASLLEQGVAMGSEAAAGTEAGMDAATLGNKVPGGLSKTRWEPHQALGLCRLATMSTSACQHQKHGWICLTAWQANSNIATASWVGACDSKGRPGLERSTFISNKVVAAF